MTMSQNLQDHNEFDNRKSQQPYHIVYLHTHDTGRWIEPYDQQFRAPNLMKLASRGTVLNQLFSVGPTCSPSRSGLLTGRYPHQNGMTGLAHRGFALNEMDQHLCRYLSRHGYATVLCGIQHVAANPDSIGYDRIHISEKHDADNLTAWDCENGEAACAFLREPHDQPFFLSYGLFQTHRPFLELDDDINQSQIKVPSFLPDVPETREDMARFMTALRRADQLIGQVLDTLDEQNLLDQTIILYTTDHGPAFPFVKCTLSDEGIGVAGIIDFPHNRMKGQALDVMLSQLDVYPTLCDLIGITPPSWLEGYSFAPLLEAKSSEPIRDEIYAEVSYHAAYEPQRCIRTGQYKLIERHADHRPKSPDRGFPADQPRLANIDSGLTKTVLENDGRFSHEKQHQNRFRYANTLLFDLTRDQDELNNLAGDPAYIKIEHELAERLRNWQFTTQDELLSSGYVRAPVNAVINRQSSQDPGSETPSDYE